MMRRGHTWEGNWRIMGCMRYWTDSSLTHAGAAAWMRSNRDRSSRSAAATCKTALQTIR